MNYNKTIASRILVSIDRFFNWLSGGNVDNTISARVGYFMGEDKIGFWLWLGATINLAFYPIDGPQHCLQAYYKEIKEDPENDFKKGSKVLGAFLSLFVLIGCVVIALILWTIKLFGPRED